MSGTEQDSRKAIEQNLKDAGCDAQMIEECLECLAKGKIREELRQLERHRGLLLERLHVEQKKIDCLDYLIYTTKRQL